MSVVKKNILIFPAGSEIGFEIFHSLKYNMHVRLFGASGKDDHARFIYPSDRYETDDFYIDNEDFVDRFNTLLDRWNIDFIYPTHDSIALKLAKVENQLDAMVIGSALESVQLARSKRATYECFGQFDFCPKVFGSPEEVDKFPVFLKPDVGQGGKGTILARNPAQLHEILSKDSNLLITEFLPGDELSVDCFSDRHGQLRFVGPRTRERVTIGISYESEIFPLSSEIEEIAKTINNRISLRGAWFFQIKKDGNGEWKLMEFACRQASTMGVYRQNGINFALLSLFDAMGYDVDILDNKIPIRLSRRLQNVYDIDYQWNTVYIDFDDTITVDEKINALAMSFLYQCKNRGKKIILITKHRFDLKETLRRYAISEQLFDEILHLTEDQEKSDFIDAPNSVFIDNYYFDRKKVAEKGVPVFDVDAIESLMEGA